MNQLVSFFLVFILLVSCRNETTNLSESIEVNYSSDKGNIQAPNLINPLKIYSLLSSYPETYLPVQVSSESIFNKEHIPGAKNIWRPDYSSDSNDPYGGLIPSRAKLEKLLQHLGFQEGMTLVLYDVKSNVDALRLAWIFELYGFQDFIIINGGLKYWKLQNLPVVKDNEQKTTVTNYKLEISFDTSIYADFDDLISAIGDSNSIIVDTREDYEYKGMPFIHKSKVVSFKNGAFIRGSIPGSVHLNWSTLADLNGDHRIKSEKDLRYDLDKRGIHPEKQVLLYCHSGSRTSHTYYILKHVLGYENVKNYDGSWIEWSYKNSLDASVPIQQLCSDTDFEKIKDSLISSF